MVSMGHDYARKVSAKWVEKMVSIPTRFCRITSNLSDFLLCTNRIYYLHILHGFLGSSSMKSEKFTHSLKDALLELWVSLCSSQTLAAGVYSHKGIPTSRRSKGSDCRLIECPTMTKGSNTVPGQRSPMSLHWEVWLSIWGDINAEKSPPRLPLTSHPSLNCSVNVPWRHKGDALTLNSEL